MNRYIVNAFVAFTVDAENDSDAYDKAYDQVIDHHIKTGKMKFYIERIESNLDEDI